MNSVRVPDMSVLAERQTGKFFCSIGDTHSNSDRMCFRKNFK